MKTFVRSGALSGLCRRLLDDGRAHRSDRGGRPPFENGAFVTPKFYGGWTAGFDTGFDRFEGDVFLGGVTLDLGEHVSATYACTAGAIGFGTDATGYSHSIVVHVQLTCRLKYVFQSDYICYDGVVSNPASLVGPLGSPVLVNRYGVNNYVIRPEIRWDVDDDGFTVDPAREDQVGFGMDMILAF